MSTSASSFESTHESDPRRPIFLLFDGHAVIYRAYYALPKLTDSQGRVVNAVYGFARIVLRALKDFEPEYAAVTFDHPKPTFRHKEYEEYKAQRPEMPDDLQPQIPLVKDVVDALNIPRFEIEGYEADDLIGTVSRMLDEDPQQIGAGTDLLTVIVTGDRDIFQLVDDNTHVWIPGRGRRPDKEYDARAVESKMQVRPDQIVDMKALMGDSSDNIPGIKGIGKKTAAALLKEHGSLDRVYQVVEQIEQGEKKEDAVVKGSVYKKLKNNREQAYLSQKLAEIDCRVPLEINLDCCAVESYDKTQAVELFKQFDFKSLISLLPDDEFEGQVQASLF